MSYSDVRKVSRQDIQLVQNLIERCLQLYMNQKEVVDTLLTQAKIEPGFTELVWQKLEEENREFFKAYHARLKLKDQIVVFNELLEKQVALMRQAYPSGVASGPLSNGSSTSTLHQISSCHLSDHSTTSRPQNGVSSGSVINGGATELQNMQLGNGSSVTRKMDASTSMASTQNSHIGTNQGMDRPIIKSESNYPGPSDFAFGVDGSFIEARPTSEDAPCAPFSSLLLTDPPLNEPLLDTDASSFGFLSQIPRNFSFSDLTDDFSQGTDILVNYGRSPFLAPEANTFMDSPDGDCQEDENWRLDTISEGLSYDDFGSD